MRLRELGRAVRGEDDSIGAEALAVAASVAPFAVLAPALWFLCDDAFISYRYARHLAEGHGWRFNLGDHTPVEGLSNLLWTAIAAGVEAAGTPAPDVMPWLSLPIGALGLVLLYWIARRQGVARVPATAVTVAVACCPVWAAWSTGGLETVPFAVTLLGLSAVLFLEGPAWLAALLVPVLLTLRVDGVVWLALLAWVARERRVTRVAVGTGVAVLVALSAWRLSTFGTVVPNVVAIKVGLTPTTLARGVVYLLLAAVVFPGLAIAAREAYRRDEPYAQLALLGLGYIVLTGGDYLPFFRFVVPVVPLLALAAAPALAAATPVRATAITLVVVVTNVLSIAPVQWLPEDALYAAQSFIGTKTPKYRPDVKALQVERDRVPFRRGKARLLTSLTEPGDVIVARGVGALGYDTELFVLDQYGLVSREVAEEGGTTVRAPGHDRRVQRGFFMGYDPQILFAIGLPGRSKSEVFDAFPRQWGVFEDVGDGLVYVAELHANPDATPSTPKYLLLVRLIAPGEDPITMREAFKDAARAAGYRAPPIPPLDERRRAVALEKRRGGDNLMEVLWGPKGVPRRK